MVDSPTTLSKAAPLNTAAMLTVNSAMMTAESFDSGSPTKFIEGQVAQGQRSFVHSETLPTKMYGEAKKVLEKAGLKLCGEVPKDKLFQYVELPEGWKKIETPHPMWSKLIDHKGRERASICYKAASHDRAAHLDLIRRYSYCLKFEGEDMELKYAVCIDGKDIIHSTAKVDSSGEAEMLAEAWLNDNYPNWRDESAYWD